MDPELVTRIKKFTRKHWGKFTLGFVLFLAVASNFSWGKFIIGNDNFSPELNPGLTIERILTNPAWREYRVVGVASDSEQADLFRALLYYVLDLFLPKWLISQLYLLSTLCIGSWFMALFTRNLLRDYTKLGHSELVFVVSGLVYLLNLRTLGVYYFMVIIFIAVYGYLPFLLYWTQKLLRKRSKLNYAGFILAIMLLSTSALTATSFIVAFLTWLLILLILLALEGKLPDTGKEIAVVAFSIIIISSFWTGPFLYYFLANADDITNSYINRTITPNTVENELDTNNLINTITYRFSWLNTQFDDKIYTFAYHDYYQLPVIIILLIMPVGLMLLGAVSIWREQRQQRLPFLGLLGLYLLGLVITAGRNPPFGGLFALLQDNVPFFEQVFRWQSSKIWPMLLIPTAVLAPVGAIKVKALADSVLEKTDSWAERYINRPFRWLLLSSIIALPLLAAGWPILTGNLIFQRYYLELPPAYSELKTYLDKRPDERIYLAPEANTLYFRNHNWEITDQTTENTASDPNTTPGFWGSGFLHYLLPNPLVEKNLTIGSNAAEDAQVVIEQAYYSNDQHRFAEALRLYRTNLVLSDLSNTSAKPGYTYNWDLHKSQVQQNPYLERVWDHDFLELYQLKQPSNPTNAGYVSPGHDWRKLNQLRLASENYTDYVTGRNKAGAIYPLAMTSIERKYSDGRLVEQFVYTGPASEFSLKLPDVADLPAQITIHNQQWTLRPATPSLVIKGKDLMPNFPSQTITVPDRPAFLALNNNVIAFQNQDAQALILPLTIKETANLDIYSSDYLSSSLTNQFRGKELTNCEGEPLAASTSNGSNTYPLTNSNRCLATALATSHSGVVQVELELNLDTAALVNLCLNLKGEPECLNEQRQFSLTAGRQALKTHLFTPLTTGSELVLTLGWKALSDVDPDQRLTIRQARLNYFNDLSTVNFNYPTSYSPSKVTVKLEPNQKLDLQLPLNQFNNGADLVASLQNSTQLNAGGCANEAHVISQLNDGKAVELVTKACVASIEEVIPQHNTSPLYHVWFDNLNTQATPTSFKLYATAEANPRSYYSQIAAYKDRQTQTDLVLMPERSEALTFNATSLGFKSRASNNVLYNAMLTPLPASWLDIYLEPTKLDKVNLAELANLNQASASGWWQIRPSSLGRKNSVLINGWQQGFKHPQGNNTLFYPNALAYGIPILIVYYLLVTKHFFKPKTRDSSEPLRQIFTRRPTLQR